jgi:hypothetical protein
MFPALYVRVRLGYIKEACNNPEVSKTRLTNLLKKRGREKCLGTRMTMDDYRNYENRISV